MKDATEPVLLGRKKKDQSIGTLCQTLHAFTWSFFDSAPQMVSLVWSSSPRLRLHPKLHPLSYGLRHTF